MSAVAVEIPEQSDDRPGWLAVRRSGIGSSDAVALAGASKYMTPLGLWLDKRGEGMPDEPSEEANWGHRLEPLIADQFEAITGLAVNETATMWRHPDLPWMQANPDRFIAGRNEGLEIKVRYSSDGFDSDAGAVPIDVELQCRHSMAVMDFDAWHVAALCGGIELRIVTVQRDAQVEADLIAMESAFWQLVEDGTPPAVTSADGPVLSWWHRQIEEGTAVVGDDAWVARLCERFDLKRDIKAMEDRVAEIDALTKAEIAKAQHLLDPNGKKLASFGNPSERATVRRQLLTSYPRQAARMQAAAPTMFAALFQHKEPQARRLSHPRSRPIAAD